MLQAFGYVAFTTASTALVVTLVNEHERAQRLAVFGAAANLAISLTPAAIAVLLTMAPVQAGLVATAVFAGVGGALAMLLPSFQPTGSTRIEWSIPKRVWLPMLQAGLLGAGFASFFQFAPILADRREVSSGLLYTTYGAAIIATRVFGGQLLDRLPVSRVVAVATVSMVVGDTLAAISQTGDLGLLVMASALIAVSGGLFHPALLAHHAALLPQTPGRASAAFYVAFDLGNGLGSWLFGIALQLAGLSGLYATAAAVVALTLPLAAYTSRRHA
jgi:predicted MFS family arabinose efflux permease